MTGAGDTAAGISVGRRAFLPPPALPLVYFAGSHVSLAFAVVHGNWWLTSIVWALMIGALLMYTKSLGACIIAHAVTNLLLAVYVLRYRDWAFW